jgi:hypothetical protein
MTQFFPFLQRSSSSFTSSSSLRGLDPRHELFSGLPDSPKTLQLGA